MTTVPCLVDLSISEIQVIFGAVDTGVDNNQSRWNISQIFDHPSYDDLTFSYTFSLLRLKDAISFAELGVTKACLPSVNEDDDVLNWIDSKTANASRC